jgi:hypothetical protein
MGEPRLAATDRHGLDAPDIGFGRDRIRVRRWALVVVEAVGGACKQADPHIVLRHDDGAVTMERGIPAGLLAMEMGIDQILYGKARAPGDGRLDPIMQRRQLGVHHDDAIVADHDQDVAALAFEHVGLAAEVGALDLGQRGIGPLRLRGTCREHRCGGQLHQGGPTIDPIMDPAHGLLLWAPP